MQTIHYDRIRLMRNNVRNRIYHFHSAHYDPEMKVIYKKQPKTDSDASGWKHPTTPENWSSTIELDGLGQQFDIDRHSNSHPD
jgi:hypothetical protein